MSTHLPDSIVDWPQQHGAVLNVADDADRREVRRAYSRLIKVFRPETEPAKFQRIRNAYEQLLAALSDKTQVHPGKRSRHKKQTINNAKVASHGTSATTVEFESAWQNFATDPPGAYATMRRFAVAGANQQIWLKLYWALLTHAELDDRDAAEWLTDGLRETGFSDEMLEVYCQLLENDPQECRQKRCRNLLKCRFQSTTQFGRFVFARWNALGQIKAWSVVADDFKVVRNQISIDASHLWGQLLLSTFDHAFQANDAAGTEFIEQLQTELANIKDTHLELDSEFQRYETLAELRRTLKSRLSGIGQELIQLVRDCVSEDFARVQTRLWKQVSHWFQSPTAALFELDQLEKYSPLAVQILIHQIELLRSSRQSNDDQTELIDEIVAAFMNRYGKLPYEEFRERLVNLCMEEYIVPGDVCGSLLARSDLNPDSSAQLIAKIENDMSLLCVCLACHAMLVTA